MNRETIHVIKVGENLCQWRYHLADFINMVEENRNHLAVIKGEMIGAFATYIAVAALQYFSIF
jgi:hypothetical protein